MIIVPMASANHKNDRLVIILDKTNVERMKGADPAQIICKEFPIGLVNPSIMVCYEEDSPKLNQLINSGDIEGLLEFVNRGFKFRPDLGDSDRGPKSLYEQN